MSEEYSDGQLKTKQIQKKTSRARIKERNKGEQIGKTTRRARCSVIAQCTVTCHLNNESNGNFQNGKKYTCSLGFHGEQLKYKNSCFHNLRVIYRCVLKNWNLIKTLL